MRWIKAALLIFFFSLTEVSWAAPVFSSLSIGHTASPANAEQFQQIRSYYSQIQQKNFERLNKLISENRIKGLEYVFAGPSQMRIEAIFGHAMLRFVDDDDDPYNDLVIAFVADVDEPKISASKGIFGLYPMMIDILSLGQFSIMYLEAEGRYLERYPLSLSQEQIKKAALALLEMNRKHLQNPNSRQEAYSFFNKNCARTMALFLAQLVGRTPRSLMPPIAPGLVPRYLRFLMIQSVPTIRIRSTYSVVEEMAGALGVNKELLLKDQWPDLPDNFFKNWTADEVARLFIELGPRSKSARSLILQRITEAQSKRQVFFRDMISLPQEIYLTCESITCTKQKAQLYSRLWNAKALQISLGRMSEALYYEGRKFSEGNSTYDVEHSYSDLFSELRSLSQ